MCLEGALTELCTHAILRRVSPYAIEGALSGLFAANCVFLNGLYLQTLFIHSF